MAEDWRQDSKAPRDPLMDLLSRLTKVRAPAHSADEYSQPTVGPGYCPPVEYNSTTTINMFVETGVTPASSPVPYQCTYAPEDGKLSSDELLRYSERHLSYEALMFSELRSLLRRLREAEKEKHLGDKTVPTEWEFVGRGLVESYLIHFRNLVAFFQPPWPHEDKNREPRKWPRAKDGTDVLAEQYCENGCWEREMASMCMERKLATLVDRVSKDCAHLTTKRRDGARNWDVDELSDLVRPYVEKFLQLAVERDDCQLSQTAIDALRRI
ncbi:MAG: hypothetical protein IT163_13070 [Bryobacterales bacterium]|nr:hypothetical protein [Bryobacterales bacterium]